jgi:hypothetical protein
MCEFHLDPGMWFDRLQYCRSEKAIDRYGQRLFERNFSVKGVTAEGRVTGQPSRLPARS